MDIDLYKKNFDIDKNLRINKRMECLGHINEILYQDYKSLIYIEENRINLSINQIVDELDFVYNFNNRNL